MTIKLKENDKIQKPKKRGKRNKKENTKVFSGITEKGSNELMRSSNPTMFQTKCNNP